MFELPLELRNIRSKIKHCQAHLVVSYSELAAASEYHRPSIEEIARGRLEEMLMQAVREKMRPDIQKRDDLDGYHYKARVFVFTEYELNEMLYLAYSQGKTDGSKSRLVPMDDFK